jgi:hypothetical protein
VLTEEQIRKLKDSFDLSNRTNFLNNNYINEARDIINSVITNPLYKNTRTISANDIEFTDYTLGDKKVLFNRRETAEEDYRTIEVTFSSKKKLSNCLFDIYYPKVTDSCFYHFTKISALRQILKGEIKLNPLIVNENYDEFRTFYIDHDLLGYFKNKDYDGQLMKDSIMKETFSLSLASKTDLSAESENRLWSSFGDNGYGVRIEFEIETKHPDFRKIFYRDKNFNVSDLAIRRLIDLTRSLYKREFFISGVSKIGAFYLPGDYNIENEVRFVVKQHTDEYEFHYEIAEKGFLMLPFQNKYAEVKIKEIKIGDKCDNPQKEEIIKMVQDAGYLKEIIV